MPTIRQQMLAHLEKEALTVRDLSQRLQIKEKEVFDHLAHIRSTLKARQQKLEVVPYRCLGCDFVFKKRMRLGKPSRCPLCKSGPIEPAKYRIQIVPGKHRRIVKPAEGF